MPQIPFEKNSGSFSISENKLRVRNRTGQSSVLLEDISSITWAKRSMLNSNLVIIGFITIFIGPIVGYGLFERESVGLILLFAGFAICTYGLRNKVLWDDVIIETRGGLLLTYSVEAGLGESETDKIETARSAAGH